MINFLLPKMIKIIEAHSLVSQKVLDEEVKIVKVCSCCQQHYSTMLMIQCRGIAVVLEHVCRPCWSELEYLILSERETVKVALVVK